MAADPIPDFAAAVSPGPDGTLVDVWAVPGASQTGITGLHDGSVRIRVSAPPEGGKANRSLAKVLANLTGTDVELVAGRNSRRKRFLIRGVSPAAVVDVISEHLA